MNLIDVMEDWKDRLVAQDCRYFLGDRPCIWHKKDGVLCVCTHYVQITERILVIKLGAMGDVLRTTCVLPALAHAHPNASISWITRSESLPLLENNPFIAETVCYDVEGLIGIVAQEFDWVINFDTDKSSLALTKLINGKKKTGFFLDGTGCIRSTNDSAKKWFKMGVFDDLKKRNTQTYQDMMCNILEIASKDIEYVLNLTEEELNDARRHLESIGVSLEKPLIGLNTGAGSRWQFKQWREEGFVELIDKLYVTYNDEVQIILLGGVAEKARNQRIAGQVNGPVTDAGADNSTRHFSALIAFCDVVVSGDTLAMHIALALGRRTVILFGPTSAPEIEVFGFGKKIVPDLNCLGCYKTTCDFVPNCMQVITADMVKDAVIGELKKAKHLIES